MVENSETNNALFKDIESTKAFISQSEKIQKSIQSQVKIKEKAADGAGAAGSKKSLKQPEDDLPRFGAATGTDDAGSKFNDPF